MKKNILVYLLLLCSISIFAQVPVEPPRTCDVCKKTKPASEFSGDSKTCKACAQKKPETRTCSSCKKTKALNAFSGKYKICKECVAKIEEEERAAREKAEKERLAQEQAEQERVALRDKVNSLIKMVHVEGGTFVMGGTFEQGSEVKSDERPTHLVTLPDFQIGQTEVTQELWEIVMGFNPSFFKGAKLPVEKVSWDDCQEFVAKLNQITGKKYGLPTEAEWEYAARGGKKSKHYKYAGSNMPAEVAWYDKNSYNLEDGDPNFGTHLVGSKQPNELGLYDMSGNVSEWCQSLYERYNDTSAVKSKKNDSEPQYVFRGGSWCDFVWKCRVSDRNKMSPASKYIGIGLRLILLDS